jgi:hypothetical protein
MAEKLGLAGGAVAGAYIVTQSGGSVMATPY